MIQATADERTVVIGIDDVHHLDSASQDVLELALSRLLDTSMFLVGAYRNVPKRVEREIPALLASCTSIEVQKLTPRECSYVNHSAGNRPWGHT